jgi:hypothetical protein
VKLDSFKQKANSSTNRMVQQETVIRDLKNSILKLQTEKLQREREMQAREEELYLRDTQILKKQQEIESMGRGGDGTRRVN